MVSGKYSALSGAIAREQAMDNIAANLANVSTTGFKKNRISFESVLNDAKQVTDAGGINYSRIRKIGTDFGQGGMQETGSELDLAIVGDGFFKIRKGNDTFYTRSGHFMLDENGMVKTEDGFNLLAGGNQPVQLQDSAGKIISIDDNGNIAINGQISDSQIQIYSVNDDKLLKQVGNSLFQLEQGGTDQGLDDFRVVQGSLETSNVNMMEEMALMINTQRKFEADLKIMESYSKLGDKQNELGSIS